MLHGLRTISNGNARRWVRVTTLEHAFVTEDNDRSAFLSDVIAAAKRAGADQTEVTLVETIGIRHCRRLDQLATLERKEIKELALRVIQGNREAFASTSELSMPAACRLIDQTLALTQALSDHAYVGLPEKLPFAGDGDALDLFDERIPTDAELLQRAQLAESAARSVGGVTNSETVEASWTEQRTSLAASDGFSGSYIKSCHRVAATIVAGEIGGLQRDTAETNAVHAEDLDAPEQVGLRAAQRAAARVGPRRVATRTAPVIYEPRVAASLLDHFSQAVSGSAILAGMSLLSGSLGAQVFQAEVRIVDDARRVRGLGSRPFDAEGVSTSRRTLVEKGILRSWLLDSKAARQLHLESTGHAARNASSPPSPAPTNLYFECGSITRETLVADVKAGLYVTELFGHPFNTVNITTGNYSRGAAGFWIENGEFAFPVAEVTISGNLRDMWRWLIPADDLRITAVVSAPTVRVDSMTIGGS